MNTLVESEAMPPVSTPSSAESRPLETTSAQRMVHRAFLCGVTLGLLQVVAAGTALWLALRLLKGGTLVTPSAVLLPAGCLVWSCIALISMARLRKHQRFNSFLPALCHLAGLVAGVAMALIHYTRVLGPNGLRGFLVQLDAVLPAGTILGEPTPVLWLALLVALGGALAVPPLYCLLRLHLNPESRRLLKWMATK